MSAKNSMWPIWAGLMAGAALSIAASAHAANFAVAPVDVTLEQRDRSHLIVLTNQDSTPLRFQLSAYKWGEQPDGRMVLEPTDDLIFFPQLFDIKPHESQNVRVGTVAPAMETEKTYRLVMHQLKAFEPPRAAGKQRNVVVNVLTNVSIPVFIEPAAPDAKVSISSMSFSRGKLSFTVKNSGNAHFRISSMQLDGFGQGTQPVFSKTAKGWYVLAGGWRDYAVPLSARDCSQLVRLDLLVRTDRGQVRTELPVSPGACSSTSVSDVIADEAATAP